MKPVRYLPNSFWNAERDAELSRMWLADEHSAEEISCALGAPSRNAVIGRAHRIGLPSKAGRGRGQAKGKSLGVHPRETMARIRNGRGKPFVFLDRPQSRLKALQLEGLPIPPPAETDIPRVSTINLEPHHCRWPCVADAREVSPYEPIFCGADKAPGLSYCRAHALRAFTPPRPTRDDIRIPAQAMPATSTKVLDSEFA